MPSVSNFHPFLQVDSRRPLAKPAMSTRGTILIRFDPNSGVSVYPMADDLERLAHQFAEVVALFYRQPGLVLAAWGLSDKNHA
jgi:hypothetical protein